MSIIKTNHLKKNTKISICIQSILDYKSSYTLHTATKFPQNKRKGISINNFSDSLHLEQLKKRTKRKIKMRTVKII